MASPAIALAFIPFFITLLIRYRHYFVLFYRAVILRKFQDYVTGISREERAFQYIMTHAVAGDPDNILHTLDTWCYTTEYVSYVGPKKGKILERLLYEKEPVSVLELGTHCGYATIRIARSLSLKARLYSVEMDQRNATVADKIIRLAGFDEDLIELIVEPSDELIPRFRERYGVDKVDFVFMDHWKRSYLRDLKLLEDYNLLEEGCVILADNVLFPGAPRFLQYVKTCGKYRWKLHRAHLEYFRSIRDGMAELIYIGVK